MTFAMSLNEVSIKHWMALVPANPPGFLSWLYNKKMYPAIRKAATPHIKPSTRGGSIGDVERIDTGRWSVTFFRYTRNPIYTYKSDWKPEATVMLAVDGTAEELQQLDEGLAKYMAKEGT